MRIPALLLLAAALLPLQGAAQIDLEWSEEDTKGTLHNVCVAVYMNLSTLAKEAGSAEAALGFAELAARHGIEASSTEDRMLYTLWVMSVLKTAGVVTAHDWRGFTTTCKVILNE